VLTFALAFVLAIISPGPGVLSTAGVGAAYGFRAGFGYVTGLFIGTNLVGLAVVTGLAAVILASPVIRTVLFAASTCYLLYLAARIAFAGSNIAFIQAHKQPGITEGILLQAINPKAYVVNTVFITGFAFMPGALATEILLKFVIMNAIWIPIHLLWLWAGGAVKRLDLPAHIQRRINFAMAGAMLLVVALAAMSALQIA
jgi:threonine/homoserine/homoserine lactone efflux protein